MPAFLCKFARVVPQTTSQIHIADLHFFASHADHDVADLFGGSLARLQIMLAVSDPNIS
jgi:hypothetical protein